MTTATAQTTATTDFRPEDVQQAERLEPARPARVVPPALARQGFEVLDTPGFNIADEFYVYRPLRAWDAAQFEADNLIRVTGGRIYSLVESIRDAIKAAIEVDLSDEPEAERESMRERIFQQMVMTRWTDFLANAPDFSQVEWATRMLKKCEVRRIAKPEHHNKPDSDPTKDFAGLIFEVTGAGHVDTYYRGRRTHLVRVGLAAGWGSLGDFFVEH